MTESAKEPLDVGKLKQEYLELTKEQSSFVGWTEEKRRRLLYLKSELGIDQPKLTDKQRSALHRQGTADTPETSFGKPRPSLTPAEKKLIIEANQASARKK